MSNYGNDLACHGYILMTIGSVFFFGTRTFVYKLKNNRKSYITENDSIVCYFNKVRYLFGMNNQLTLPRTERLFYFNITSSQWIETSDVTLHFGATIMPFGPVTLIFYWPKKKFSDVIILSYSVPGEEYPRDSSCPLNQIYRIGGVMVSMVTSSAWVRTPGVSNHKQ